MKPGGVWALRLLIVLAGLIPWLAWALPEPAWQAAMHSLSSFCHQRPERTVEWMGKLMPVCSRCAGIYAGLILGNLLTPPHLARHWRWWLGIAMGLMVTDVLIQDWVRMAPWHPSRMVTGLFLGWVLTGGAVTLLSGDDRVH